jgi:hypothetical protein
MAETKEKPKAQKESQITKELFGMLIVSIVFFLLWGWLISADAVVWLQPTLLALAVISGVWCLVHAVLKELVRHGFKQ